MRTGLINSDDEEEGDASTTQGEMRFGPDGKVPQLICHNEYAITNMLYICCHN